MTGSVAVILTVLGLATGVTPAQAPVSEVKPAVQAFEQYEAIRTALFADNLKDAIARAKDLAASPQALGGDPAKRAVEQLARATTLEDARAHFGDLSAILVPIFQQEAIAGVHAFVCPMKKKTWAQKGDQLQNPYYGKAMATCGNALPSKAK